MTPPQFVDAIGSAVLLDRKLGSGGEGAVYGILNDPGRVAKVYHSPPSRTTAEKLAAMIAVSNSKLLSVATWPDALIFDKRTRQVAGFTMSRLVDYQDIWLLYNPNQRLKYFPRAGWTFQIRAAQNLAAAFDEVHGTGCVVGDVQLKNAVVSSQALVRLVDCDSFQIVANNKPYYCEVGLLDYTPPELQGKHLKTLLRTVNHDRFGLAVLIYQLLFVGRHPYAGYIGSDEPTPGQLIAEFRFNQGPMAHSLGMALPKISPTFEDIPNSIGMLFRQAFERGSENGTRPKPVDWISALKQLEQETVVCQVDAGHKYWRGAKGCTWCRLANNDGPEYYLGVDGGSDSFSVDDAKLQDVKRRLAAAKAAEFPYFRQDYRVSRRWAAKAVPVELAQLLLKSQALYKQHQSIIVAAQFEEAETAALEIRKLEALRIKLTKQSDQEFDEIDVELEEAQQEGTLHTRDRIFTTRILIAVVALGALLTPMGYFRWTIGAVGVGILIVFGVCLAVHFLLSKYSPAQQTIRDLKKRRRFVSSSIEQTLDAVKQKAKQECQRSRAARDAANSLLQQKIRDVGQRANTLWIEERGRRQLSFRKAEDTVAGFEMTWASLVTEYNKKRADIELDCTNLAADCMKLPFLYKRDLQSLEDDAESTAQKRFLRLQFIESDDIPQIGIFLKGVLAENGVVSAADIVQELISRIKGFGPIKTKLLLDWKQSKLAKFQFDSKTGVAIGDLQALNLRFQTNQKQILNVLNQRVLEFESLAPSCRLQIEKIKPQIRQAIETREQAYEDMKLMPGEQIAFPAFPR